MPGAASNDGWAAPPLSGLIVRAGDAAVRSTDDRSPASRDPRTAAPARVVADLLSVRGAAGRFLVPATSRHTAARSLLSYNRLRPRRVRAGRAVMGWMLRLGAAGLIAEPRRIEAAPGDAVLLDHLATVLDEPRVVFAATEKGGSGFVTPVLQLFSPDGRSVGFAKIGWDPVTTDMIRTEADSLTRAGAAGWTSVHVPALRWCGEWEGLWLLVTAPMPSTVRRLRDAELPPVPPLRDVAALDGPPSREVVTASQYWSDACATAARATASGRDVLPRHLEAVAEAHGGVDLAFGRWHGDWVEWNLAEADGRLYAWDWAYSAPGVPYGFDLLQFFHLRHRVLRDEPGDVALAHAAADARPGLRELGIPESEIPALVALHHAEVLLREERALQARTGALR